MTTPYTPLPLGAPVTAISRTAYNGFLEMLTWWKSSGRSGTGPLKNLVDWDQAVFSCRNDSGADVDEYGVVGIAGPLILPTENEREFLNKTPLSGVEPTVAAHLGKWAVFLAATPSGIIGKACVSGVVPVRVYVTATTDKTCDVVAKKTVNGEDCYLGTGASGTQIIWLDPTASASTIAWAIVRLGSAPSALDYTQIVTVQNQSATEEDWPAWSPIGVNFPSRNSDSPVTNLVPYIFPGDRLNSSIWTSNSQPVLGITQEPIPHGKTGSVAVRGVTPVLVQAVPSGYSNIEGREWVFVCQTEAPEYKWTMRFGLAGDARFLQWLGAPNYYSLYTDDEHIVLVDLCDVPNRIIGFNYTQTTLPPHSVCKLAGEARMDKFQTQPTTYNPNESNIVVSPGYWIQPNCRGFAYCLRDSAAVCVRLAHEYSAYNLASGLYGLAQNGTWGATTDGLDLWTGLPGFMYLGKSYYNSESPPYNVWARAAWKAPFRVMLKTGATSYMNPVISATGIKYDGTYQSGVTWPDIHVPVFFATSTGTGSTYKSKTANFQVDEAIRVTIGRSDNSFFLPFDGDYWDDPIGTVKMWNSTLASIPKGWREYTAMRNRFPIGVMSAGIATTVGAIGGAPTHSHPSGTGMASGSNLGEANHLPPYSGIIFIERYQ